MAVWEELSKAKCQTPVEVIVVASRNIHGMYVTAIYYLRTGLLIRTELTFLAVLKSCKSKTQEQYLSRDFVCVIPW